MIECILLSIFSANLLTALILVIVLYNEGMPSNTTVLQVIITIFQLLLVGAVIAIIFTIKRKYI